MAALSSGNELEIPTPKRVIIQKSSRKTVRIMAREIPSIIEFEFIETAYLHGNILIDRARNSTHSPL